MFCVNGNQSIEQILISFPVFECLMGELVFSSLFKGFPQECTTSYEVYR